MWDESGLVLYAVDPLMYDLSRGELDADRICALVCEGGGTAVRLTVHCAKGYAYFPSERAPISPDYEVGRDYVAEFAAAAQRRGLQLAYGINVASNPTVAQARPDWQQTAPDGTPHTWGGDPVLCINSDYLVYLSEFVRELVARYGPECLVFDNLALLDGCRCPACEAAFLDDTGLDIPSPDALGTERRQYVEWRLARTERLAWQLAMAAKQLRGDCRVVLSGCSWVASRAGAVGWRPDATADWLDNVQGEVAIRWYGQDLQEAELIGAYHRALGKQGWCTVEYSPLPFTRLACPPAELRAKAGSVLAAGCRPCVWPLPPIPPADDEGVDALGTFLGQFSGERGRLDIEGPFARTGIVHSRQGAETGLPGTHQALRAWCNALTREHILWDFVLDRQLAAGDVAQYRLLVVPGTPYLDHRALGIADAFARRGRSVLFAAEATLYGADGERLGDFAAAAMLGVRAEAATDRTDGLTSAAGYLRVADAPLGSLAGALIPAGSHVPVDLVDGDVIATAVSGAEHRLGLARDPEIPRPAITWRMHGGGRVAYVASRLEDVLEPRVGPAFPIAERMVGQLVRWLGGERVRIRARPNVTVQMYRALGGATVHIVNKPPGGGHVWESVPPSGRIEILVPQTLYAANVRALDGTEVKWSHSGDRLSITVSDVEEYRCLAIEGALG